MSFQDVALDVLIEPATLERARGRDLPILSMTMHEGLVDQGVKFKKRVASANTNNYKLVRRNQLVVGFPIDEGVLSFQKLYDEAIVSPAYGTWRLRANAEVEPAYLERFLRSPRALAFYRAKLRGTTARRRALPRDVFLRLTIPLPPLPEQKRIARILDAADALRAKRREALGQLDTLLQSTFLDMFGDPVTNPMGWEETPFGDITTDTKLGLVRSSKEFGWDFGIPYVRMDAVTGDGYFLPEKVQSTHAGEDEVEVFALRPGDFLFNTRNSKELVGKVCVFPGPEGWLFNNNLMRVRFRADVEPWVIAMQFRFRRVQRELEKRKSGTTSVFAVYWKSLRTLPVLVPPFYIQHRFAAIVESVEQQKARQRAHLAELDTLFASLQSRAFRGDL